MSHFCWTPGSSERSTIMRKQARQFTWRAVGEQRNPAPSGVSHSEQLKVV